MAIDTNPLVVLRATKMLLTPIESHDLIGAYKRDNLEEAIVRLLGHYLVKSCFSSEISKYGMRAGGSLPLPII